MDNVTHVILGAAVAQLAVARRVGFKYAFIVGAIAATLPDLDIFILTGDEMRNHALHRHFTHALCMVPVLAAFALLPMLLARKARALWRPLYLAAVLACATHSLLDLLTPYGTTILWPLSDRRYSLDLIAVVDPAYTIPLIIGVWLAWKWKSLRPALAALLISSLYLGVAVLQHVRAEAAQRELLAARGVSAPENPRVLPQVGAVISYRSLYVADGQVHVDAIRVPFFAAPRFKPGGQLPRIDISDLQAARTPQIDRDFAAFSELADGFVARSPSDPLLLADLRYAYQPEGLQPVWGLQLEQTAAPQFRIIPRWNYIGKLVRDLFRPAGYIRLPLASPSPGPP